MNTDDPVFRVLDPHVRSGSLSPEQASRLYDDLSPLVGVRQDHDEPRDRRTLLKTALVAMGVGLVMAGVAVAINGRSVYEPFEDFSFKTAMISVGSVLALAAAAVGLVLRGSHQERKAAGICLAAAGFLLSPTLLDMADDGSMMYVSGGLLLIVGVLGYVWLRRPVITLVAVLGAVQLGAQAMVDAFDDFAAAGPGDVLLVGLMGAGFGLAVAGAGWRTNAHRMLLVTGVLIAQASLALTAAALSAVGLFLSSDLASYDTVGSSGDAKADATLACVLGLLLTAGCLVTYFLRREEAALVLTWLGASTFGTLLPLAQGFEHPVVWGAFIGLAGVLEVAGAVVPGLVKRG